MSEPPDWFCVLRYAVDKQGFQYGLSFSFLVGAMRDPIGARFNNAEDAHRDSEKLYESMKSPYGVWIANIDNCGNDEKVGGSVVTLVYKDRYCEHPNFDDLWKEYGDAIQRGEFSKNGSFHAITPEETAWIEQARGNDWANEVQAKVREESQRHKA
jgi:hypothetical protein